MVDEKLIAKIKVWLDSENKDRTIGLELLSEVTNNNRLVFRLQRKHNTKQVIEKIEWELQRYLPKVEADKPKPMPPVILRIKAELPILYNQRAELHKELVDLGEDNSEETMAKAVQIGELIDVLAERHQLLHDAKELFFKEGTEPNELELFPDPETSDEDEGTESGSQGKDENNEDPFGLKVKDPVDLLQRKGNLISSLTKDRNKLLYQADKKLDKENPMPEGKKRDAVLDRIKVKEEEIQAITDFLKPKDDVTPDK